MEETATTTTNSSKEEEEEIIDLNQISLRSLHFSDINDVMVWTSDEKVASFVSWEPHTCKLDGVHFIETMATKSLYSRAICLNDRAIGCVSLTSYSAKEKFRSKSAEIGFVLGSKFWGKGIVTHVVKQVVKDGFKELPELERIEAHVDVENIASQKVLEKAGFQREGILRKYFLMKGKTIDIVMFSILLTDPHL